jgi:predicted ester cyclase
MSTQDNKAISHRILEAMNARDFASLKALMVPTLYEEFAKGFREVLAAFPDYQGKNIDTIAEGDKVVQRWAASGTHQGPFMGLAPTGKQVTFTGISIDQYAEGKLIHLWIEMNMVAVLQQLGTLPAGSPSL